MSKKEIKYLKASCSGGAEEHIADMICQKLQ